MNAKLAPFLRKTLLVGTCCILLAACESEEAGPSMVQDFSDPLMDGVLADQIMIDPDMVNRNMANRAITLGPDDGSIPQVDRGADAIRAARAEAIEIVGGTNAMRAAPLPERIDGELPEAARLSVAARAASAGDGHEDCAQLAQFSAIWAARMPAEFPVYPRGAVQEAAGTDENGCILRVVNFTTPVPPDDVLDFYFTQGSASGFETQHVVQDGEEILGGTANARSFMVFVRQMDDGMTSVDLVTTGS